MDIRALSRHYHGFPVGFGIKPGNVLRQKRSWSRQDILLIGAGAVYFP